MRTTIMRAGAVLGAAGAALATAATPASAHEKWFVPEPGAYPTDWSFTWRPLTLTLILAVVAVTLVWRLRSGNDDDEFDDGAVV